MSRHQPQKTEKSEPAVIRQDSADSLSEQNTYQEAPAMHQSTSTPMTVYSDDDLRAQFDLPGGQATFVLQPLLPEQPGVMTLGAVTGGDDKIGLQVTTEQARDLADWIYCTADEVDAEQEAHEQATRTAEQVDLGGPTLAQIGEVLARQGDTLMVGDMFILATALGIKTPELAEAMCSHMSEGDEDGA